MVMDHTNADGFQVSGFINVLFINRSTLVCVCGCVECVCIVCNTMYVCAWIIICEYICDAPRVRFKLDNDMTYLDVGCAV